MAPPVCRAERGKSSKVNEMIGRSEEHTSDLQSRVDLVCRLLLEKKKRIASIATPTKIEARFESTLPFYSIRPTIPFQQRQSNNSHLQRLRPRSSPLHTHERHRNA